MNITITIDGPLTEEDRTILAALAGQAVATVTLEATEPAPRTRRAAKPAPPADDADDDNDTEPTPPKTRAKKAPAADDDDLMANAVKRATELVSNGQAPKVREALATVGAKRVSELTTKTLPDFLTALDEG